MGQPTHWEKKKNQLDCKSFRPSMVLAATYRHLSISLINSLQLLKMVSLNAHVYLKIKLVKKALNSSEKFDGKIIIFKF